MRGGAVMRGDGWPDTIAVWDIIASLSERTECPRRPPFLRCYRRRYPLLQQLSTCTVSEPIYCRIINALNAITILCNKCYVNLKH